MQIIAGEFVEPVLLQVVCRSLWDRLPAGATKITPEHLHKGGSVDQALRQLYDDAVRSALRAVRAGAMPRSDRSRESIKAALRAVRFREGQLRARIEDGFITSLERATPSFRAPCTRPAFLIRQSTHRAGAPAPVRVRARGELFRAHPRFADRADPCLEQTAPGSATPDRCRRSSRDRWRLGGRSLDPPARERRTVKEHVRRPQRLAAGRSASHSPGRHRLPRDIELRQAAFDPIPIGQTTYKSVVLASGDERLKIRAAESTSDDFQVSTSCNIEVPLPAHRTCPITVAFAPLTTGRKTAVLRVTRDAGPPLEVALSGRAR